jgi:hypothetical protein
MDFVISVSQDPPCDLTPHNCRLFDHSSEDENDSTTETENPPSSTDSQKHEILLKWVNSARNFSISPDARIDQYAKVPVENWYHESKKSLACRPPWGHWRFPTFRTNAAVDFSGSINAARGSDESSSRFTRCSWSRCFSQQCDPERRRSEDLRSNASGDDDTRSTCRVRPRPDQQFRTRFDWGGLSELSRHTCHHRGESESDHVAPTTRYESILGER